MGEIFSFGAAGVAAIVGLTTITGFAAASPPDIDECKTLQEFARVTMSWRQSGMSIADTYETFKIATAETPPPDYTSRIAPEIIKQAYYRPVEPTERLAEMTSIQFGEEIWSLCMGH